MNNWYRVFNRIKSWRIVFKSWFQISKSIYIYEKEEFRMLDHVCKCKNLREARRLRSTNSHSHSPTPSHKGLARRTWGNKFVRVSWLIPKFRIRVWLRECTVNKFERNGLLLRRPDIANSSANGFLCPETSLFMANARYARLDSAVVSMRTINGPPSNDAHRAFIYYLLFYFTAVKDRPGSSFISRKRNSFDGKLFLPCSFSLSLSLSRRVNCNNLLPLTWEC